MDPGWLLLGLVGTGAALGLGGFFHRSWCLYARFALDWEQRALDYQESLKRLESVESTELVEMLRRHDREGLNFTRARATEWMERIPAWARDRYMREH